MKVERLLGSKRRLVVAILWPWGPGAGVLTPA